MRLYTKSCNTLLELETFVAKHGIKKEDIVSLFQNSDQEYVLTYYGE